MIMNYKFTTILIIAMCLMAFFIEPAYPKNEYLTNGTNSCNTGSFDVRIETQEGDNEYKHYSPSNNYNSENGRDSLSFTYRHFLGSACTKEFRQVQQDNMELKQQLELMKMCGRVNNNPSLAQNENFRLLVSKCTGITPTETNNRPEDSGSAWDGLKDDYKKENPDITLMGDKILLPPKENSLKIPPKDFKLPEPQ